jgi:hypothetical protein
MSLLTQADHNAMSQWYRDAQEVEKAPLADRKEAAKEWAEALRDPKLIKERVGWLIGGSYGQGYYAKALQSLEMTRGNRVAMLSQYLASAEWRVPPAMASAEWLKLTPAQQQAVSQAVASEIKEWEVEHMPQRANVPVKVTPARASSVSRVKRPRLTR